MSTVHNSRSISADSSPEEIGRWFREVDRGFDGLSWANDGEVPIQALYDEGEDNPILARWAAQRATSGPPYRPWFMCYVGLGTSAQTRERLRLLQDYGAESFLLAADLPSQLGLDPTHDLARAQVGRAGMSCSTLDDLEDACSLIDFDLVDSFGMLANSVGHVGLGMMVAMLEDRRAPRVKVMMQNDPLKEYTARGTEIYANPEWALRIACDCVAYAVEQDIPGWAMTVCSNHYDVAGAGPIISIALALANAIEYVDELVRRGYIVRDVVKKIMFFFNERSDLFVEASVFRSGRVLWGEILSERYQVPIEEQPVPIVMGYAHGLESAKEPLVNIIRGTLSVAGSMLGGVDYLCAAAYDEALRVPSADASVLALRTMQVVGMEHGVTTSVDGLDGSRKLRAIDAFVCESVRRELALILEQGGALACLKNGYTLSKIGDKRGTREEQIASGERDWVGVNVLESNTTSPLLAGSSAGEVDFVAGERETIERALLHRSNRDEAQIEKLLDAVESSASCEDNLVPPSIQALRGGATLQEITEATTRGLENVAFA